MNKKKYEKLNTLLLPFMEKINKISEDLKIILNYY